MRRAQLKEIGNLRIAAPCPASWEEMAGDARVRHCTLCSLNVYNFAEMTRDEVRELLVRTEGRVCARLYRRADGTVLTRDCPTGLRALQRRASRVAAALIAALLALPAGVFGGTIGGKPRLKTRGSRVTLKIERIATTQRAMFTGVVREEGTPLPGVSIRVRDEATNRETALVTDVNGVFTMAALNDGIYRVEVILAGFVPARIEHLELKSGEVIHATIALRMDTATVITVGALAPMEMEPGKTTISEDLFKKLAILRR
jgi:hypothetical protein